MSVNREGLEFGERGGDGERMGLWEKRSRGGGEVRGVNEEGGESA